MRLFSLPIFAAIFLNKNPSKLLSLASPAPWSQGLSRGAYRDPFVVPEVEKQLYLMQLIALILSF
jgi:hypothetical protein